MHLEVRYIFFTTSLNFNVTLSVFDKDEKYLEKSAIADPHRFGGNMITPITGAFKTISLIYRGVLQRLLKNPRIAAGLK